MRLITTLETQQVLFFCDVMHPGTCRHCKNACVSETTQKTQRSLSITFSHSKMQVEEAVLLF